MKKTFPFFLLMIAPLLSGCTFLDKSTLVVADGNFPLEIRGIQLGKGEGDIVVLRLHPNHEFRKDEHGYSITKTNKTD